MSENKKDKITTLDALLTIIEQQISRERVKKLYIDKDDPRLDYGAETVIKKILMGHTVRGAYEVSYHDGYACENITTPIVGFFFSSRRFV